MNEKPPNSSPFVAGGRLFAAVIASVRAMSVRGRVVAWLLMFISAYRLGMPILFSAALAGLPWLLLPSCPVRDGISGEARRETDRAARR